MGAVSRLVLAVRAAAVLAFALGLAAPALAGEPADRVLGQARFTTGSPNFVDGRGFVNPAGIAIDRSTIPHRIWVSDFGNSRVLGWRDIARFYAGEPADLVIGQPDVLSASDPVVADRCFIIVIPATARRLCGPTSLAVDGHGNLFVADNRNRRVLEFDDPFATDRVADRVYLSPDFAAHDNLAFPEIALDRAGNLYVVDGFSRVLIYRQPLADQTPDLVYEADRDCIAHDVAVRPCAPNAVAVDAAGDLYVGDGWAVHGHDGVWVFRQPLTTDLEPDLFIDGFAAGLDGIQAMAVGPDGALYVGGLTPHEVVVWAPPLTAASEPALRLPAGGRGDGLTFDGATLLVSSELRHAVLRYDEPLATDPLPDGLVGQLDLRATGRNRVDATGLFVPRGVAVDRSATPNRLWVFDAGNSRVLGWRDASGFASGAPADLVIGQPGPWGSACNEGGLGRASLCLSPLRGGGLAVDERGTLFVADTDNHRVLAYESPFETDRIADRVIGQRGSFMTRDCNRGGISARGLCRPGALALDRDGTLWVADLANHRVLAFRDAATGDDVADRVLGQRNRFTTAFCSWDPRSLCLSSELQSSGELVGGSGLAVDERGTVYVADTENHRVLAFDAPLATDTSADRVWGQAGLGVFEPRCDQAPRRLCSPMGLALDGAGGLWVADQGNARAMRFDTSRPGAAPSRILGTLPRPFERLVTSATTLLPTGVAVDEADSVFVADPGRHRVLAFDEP